MGFVLTRDNCTIDGKLSSPETEDAYIRLINAVCSGKIEDVRNIVEEVPELVNCINVRCRVRENISTAFMESVRRELPEIAFFLLENGAKPDPYVASDVNIVLRCICSERMLPVARKLADMGYGPDDVSKVGYSPLALMIAEESVSGVEAVLSIGADIEKLQCNGMTPLVSAACHSSPKAAEIVRILIRHGANVNAQMKDGMNALMHAARKSSLEIVDELICAGAKLDVKSTGLSRSTVVSCALTNAGRERIGIVRRIFKEIISKIPNIEYTGLSELFPRKHLFPEQHKALLDEIVPLYIDAARNYPGSPFYMALLREAREGIGTFVSPQGHRIQENLKRYDVLRIRRFVKDLTSIDMMANARTSSDDFLPSKSFEEAVR